MGAARERLVEAQERLFSRYGLALRSRIVELADPPLRVHVAESGSGDPLVLIHGSGMLGATFAPLMAELGGWRLMAPDLPGFGLSDAHDYAGRGLRGHAVAQLLSLLDALALPRARLVGTSLGAMWALNLALEAPERVSGIVSLGVPAVALPGFRGDPFFTAISTPGLGALAARLRPPTTRTARRGMVNALGQGAVDRTPDEWFELVRRSMGMPGYPVAMRSHLRLAMRRGRPRAENVLGDSELRRIATPVLFLWGESDVYGGPEIGRRAAREMPDARLETLPGGHAVFLDDPVSCARHIGDFFAGPGSDAASRLT
jgi:2-hydroxy-6-oxonona-2,4-dienedioate hydrolase/4,5:9,10-diseco-3-hydroxy-5,9,17-trioxoandrosta-1(10),2-diene-4-oate hydrolase